MNLQTLAAIFTSAFGTPFDKSTSATITTNAAGFTVTAGKTWYVTMVQAVIWDSSLEVRDAVRIRNAGDATVADLAWLHVSATLELDRIVMPFHQPIILPAGYDLVFVPQDSASHSGQMYIHGWEV